MLFTKSKTFCPFCSFWRQHIGFALNLVLDWDQIFKDICILVLKSVPWPTLLVLVVTVNEEYFNLLYGLRSRIHTAEYQWATLHTHLHTHLLTYPSAGKMMLCYYQNFKFYGTCNPTWKLCKCFHYFSAYCIF